MSLLRQLLLSVTLAIAIILAGATWFSISSARQYLDTQLQAQSESSATSLALTLSQPANQDETMRELLLSAMFDSSQFKVVEFLDPDGRVLISRELDESQAGAARAPAWFSRLLPLDRHEARRQVSGGWSQLGEVRLVAYDAYARNALWDSTMRTVLLTVGAGLLWGLFVLVLMRWLRRALQDDVMSRVQALAQAGDRRTSQLPPVRHPAMLELREISQIIDSTHQRVQASTIEHMAQIESLELELHRDQVTGLANRKYFINELRRSLEHRAVDDVGHLMLFRQCDLQAINQTFSRQIVDEWLLKLGQAVQEALRERLGKDAWLARLNGSDFAFIMPSVAGPTAVRVAQVVDEILQAQRLSLGQTGLCRWRMALTDYKGGDDLSVVLARLDEALMRAESAGHTKVEYLPSDLLRADSGGQGGGEHAWRRLLTAALEQQWFVLATQADVSVTGGGTQRVTGLLNLHEAGTAEPMSGYLFMPPAVRLGLSGDCDLQAFKLGLEWLDAHAGELTLRVSLASILQEDFREQAAALLIDAAGRGSRLIIELDSFSLVAHRDLLLPFAQILYGHGVRLGLRRFAEQPEALLYLHELQPEYVRVSEALLAASKDSPGARQLMIAVQETAQELGILLDRGAAA